jgi:uncharacterized protein (DUF2062 family)
MVRKLFKIQNNKKIDQFIRKYNIPREYLAVNRKSITRGIFIGLFWGFIPMPMQMLAVVLTTPFIKFNVPVAISMVWLSNPLTMPFMYYMEYKTGLLILGKSGMDNIELTLDWFSQHWGDILVPLYVGTIPYSTIVAFLIAMIVNWLWIQSVKRAKCKKVKNL